MICKKCGKEIPDESSFCIHCGCDLKEGTNHAREEDVPLVSLINMFVKHKIIAIISIITIIVGIGCYFAIQKYKEKKMAEVALMEEVERVMKIVGTYENSSITLILSSDNTANITYKKNGYTEVSSKGYWKEKFDGDLIEIDFSNSLEDIYIGSKKCYYCSTLYLIGNTLWESMSAIQSKDYAACEFLTKNN